MITAQHFFTLFSLTLILCAPTAHGMARMTMRAAGVSTATRTTLPTMPYILQATSHTASTTSSEEKRPLLSYLSDKSMYSITREIIENECKLQRALDDLECDWHREFLIETYITPSDHTPDLRDFDIPGYLNDNDAKTASKILALLFAREKTRNELVYAALKKAAPLILEEATYLFK